MLKPGVFQIPCLQIILSKHSIANKLRFLMTGMFIPIHYASFWNTPISFLTEYEETLYLFTRYGFDEEIDDYPEKYDVFVIKDISFVEAVNNKLWYSYNFKRKEFIGTVPFYDVIFDSSRRQFVHTSVFGIIEPSKTGNQSYPD